MDFLRIYLLMGLVAHKIVWEVLKLRNPASRARNVSDQPFRLTLVKAVKVGILLGLIAQTFVGEVLPIGGDSNASRIIGIVSYTLGLVIAIVSRIQLGKNWSDIESAQVLSNHSIVSNGVYRYIRHPIYVGDLIMLLGFELYLNSWLVLGVLLLIPVVLWKAVREEKALASVLPGYDEYCARTKRFIPFIV
jgi:protein-S-isoprenylcysteine O-methyltransferase Ste14